MMSSSDIIEVFIQSFGNFLNMDGIAIEGYRLEPVKLESRHEVYGLGRVAFYEQGSSSSLKVDSGKAFQLRQNYGVDISVQYSTQKDNQDNAEFIALQIKDKLNEWLWDFSAFTETDQTLFSLQVDTIGALSRNERFCTLTVNLFSTRSNLDLARYESLQANLQA